MHPKITITLFNNKPTNRQEPWMNGMVKSFTCQYTTVSYDIVLLLTLICLHTNTGLQTTNMIGRQINHIKCIDCGNTGWKQWKTRGAHRTCRPARGHLRTSRGAFEIRNIACVRMRSHEVRCVRILRASGLMWFEFCRAQRRIIVCFYFETTAFKVVSISGCWKLSTNFVLMRWILHFSE